ncbi:ATP-dependent helicase/nuclease subunit A [Acidovorax delafieldii]|uniref:DNA 3'-5' helicase n=1 Tax=Acidovorax delafieldii TaxID=47920 RepID=A0AAJ2F2P7_ACIDE|nr:UvrD-helicase domain-containing protein [Acidovorax delafieldii]MDR6768931.1 ATP-dependent helicase/nuclease subunit A [Acidovorax delafieldii]MDR6839308.1 ATP-dependent helicase/nuclease subunit A [Acidovorax delafieldii]MDR7368859.1 ATP-dependent helicase/nuclease subunit A [Acidovorax delafieldii]
MTASISPATQAAYEHNGRPVSREAFYAIACDPARSVAVEACAGAGKTWMLVSRMLRALLDGCAPHEILAITFTKKAAGEMRQRLQEWLEQFSHKPLDELTAELIARGISPQGALDKREALQNLYRQLLEAGRPVQIRTFHSWFAALLGTAPLALLQQQGLPAHFELLEDDAEAVREVWPPFLQTVAESASLRADYEAVVARHGRSQTHKALAAALAKRVEFDLADAAGVVDASVPPFQQAYPDLAAFAEPAEALQTEAALQRWRSRASALGAEANKTPQKAADAIIDALACTDLNQRLDMLRKAMFVAKEDRLSKNLEKFPAAQEAEPELQRLLVARRQHEAWQHQQRMARLARCLIAQFAAVKQQHGWVDMNDVERTALVMLADPVLSGWVQERLDARIRHLLVDEFQDTNPLQWQALHAWLAGYAGSGGGSAAPSVFIVGDPKQSIYRFRRAEPQVFIAAQAFVRDGLGGDLLSCDHTRRNAQGVIAAVNAVMGQAQAQQETTGFRDHTTESKHRGQLLRLPAITDDDAGDGGTAARDPLAWRDSLTEPRHEAEETQRMRECTQAAAWVAAQIASGTPPKEVLVLARKRDRLATMQEALRALHLPCVQPEKSDLFDAPEVQDMVALLDALVSPTHDLSLARALKSPLFGLGDDALVALAVLRRQPEHAGCSWFDLLLKSELLAPDLQALGPVLMQYQGWVQRLPPHDALHAIYEHGDVLARFAAAAPVTQRQAVQANLRALLAAALQHDGGRYLTPYAFVRAMKKGGVRAPGRADAQAIRLLTVHGAKGLEADCVLLLDTDTRPQKAETMGVLVDWPGEQPAPSAFIFLASESNPPPSAESTLAAEQQARSREELNMLYVAMTRAKHCLALSSVQPGNSAPGSWWNRLAPLVTEVDVQTQAPAAHGAEAAAPAAPETFTIPSLPALPESLQTARVHTAAGLEGDAPVAMPGDAESTPLSRQGDAMHQLLEQAGVAGAPLAELRAHGWPAARLARLAADHDITPAAAEQAARMAQAILAGEGAWAWDAALIQTAINEAPLHYQGQSLRIDRLVQRRAVQVDDALAGWWVLDYKSATQPQRQQALVAQLQRYSEAVSALMPGEAVHAAFLTGDGRLVMVGDAPNVAGGSVATPSAVGHTSAPVAPVAPAAPVAPTKSARVRTALGPEDSPQGSLF